MKDYYYYIIYFLVVTAVCIRIIFNTNSPSKSAAYMILVIVFPIFGIFFYFTFGDNFKKKKLYLKKIKIDENAFPELSESISEYEREILIKHKADLGNFFPLANYRMSENLFTDNNHVEFLINGENKFPNVIESLKAAKSHIHIEYYIFEDGDVGAEIGEILIQKAQEGIKVRFIYDDFGSSKMSKKFIKKLINAGVEAVAFYKITFIKLANQINYRNHRKIIVIDGNIGFIGGINVADNYVNPAKSNLYWRDSHLKITGLAVLNLQYTFLKDWNFCSGQNIQFSNDYFNIDNINKNFGNQLVQIVACGPDSHYPNIMYTLMQAILLSKKEVKLTTPYFIPDKSFLDALNIAALSGIKIKIILPGISDSKIVNAATNSYIQALLDIGIEVYKYNKGFIHAKTMVCDNFVSFVGTANLDNRSFDLNFEVNAVIYDTKIAEEVSKSFDEDLSHSTKLIKEEWEKRSIITKLLERTVNLFSALM